MSEITEAEAVKIIDEPIVPTADLTQEEADELRARMYRAMDRAGRLANFVNRSITPTEGMDIHNLWKTAFGVMTDMVVIHADLCGPAARASHRADYWARP